MENTYEQLDSIFPILLSKACKNMCRDYDEVLKPYGLSKLHAFYLILLYSNKEKGFKLNDFNTILGCDKANTSRAIGDLIDKSFIYKIENIGKKYVVKLTDKGINLCTDFCNKVKCSNYSMLHILSEDEQNELYRLLNKIAKGDSDDTN